MNVMDPILISDNFFADPSPPELNASQIIFIQDSNVMALIKGMAERLSGASTAYALNASEVPMAVDSERFQYYNLNFYPYEDPSNSNSSKLLPFTSLNTS